MSDIKRYDLVGEYDLSMEEMTEGDYVLYSDHEQQLKERDAKILELQEFAIWMTGCGYDFCQHEYFCKQRDKLLK